MNDDLVRDFCFSRLPEDSRLYAELHEEFIRDPVNSRVGRFCRKAERVVRSVSDGELDWEGMLIAWRTTEQESEESIESFSEIGKVIGDHGPEIGTGSVENVGLVGDSAALSNPASQSGIPTVRAKASETWSNARSSKITIGVIAASLLVLSLGFNGWLVRSRSVERERLGFALSVLTKNSGIPVGSSDVRRALVIVEQSLGRNHPMYRAGQEQLHSVLSDGEQEYEDAQAVALEIASTSSPSDKADWLMRAARDARRLGQSAKSKQLLIEAANVPDSVLSSWAWDSLSQLEHEAGNLKDAIVFGKNAVESAEDDLWKSHMLETVAAFYIDSKEWANAEEAITNAIELSDRNGMAVGPSSYEILALAAYHMNEPAKELAARERLLASVDKGGFPRDKRFAVSIRQLAEAEFRTGDLEAADDDCLRALQEFQRIGETNGIEYAETLVLSAQLSNHSGDYAFARSMADGALTTLSQVNDEARKSWSISAAYGELAEAQRNLGDFVAAETAAQSGLEVSRQIGDARQLAARWLSLSGVSVAAGRFDEAQKRIAEAAAVSAEYSVLTRQSLLASALAGSGKVLEAADILEVALRSAMHPDNRVVMEFQLAGVLSKIPEREAEAAALLAKSMMAIAEQFPERAITSTDVATILRTVEPLDDDQQPALLLFPRSSEPVNPYFV